jgi:hypothetical protein
MRTGTSLLSVTAAMTLRCMIWSLVIERPRSPPSSRLTTQSESLFRAHMLPQQPLPMQRNVWWFFILRILLIDESLKLQNSSNFIKFFKCKSANKPWYYRESTAAVPLNLELVDRTTSSYPYFEIRSVVAFPPSTSGSSQTLIFINLIFVLHQYR